MEEKKVGWIEGRINREVLACKASTMIETQVHF